MKSAADLRRESDSLARRLLADLPGNGDCAMIRLTGDHGGRYTLYAYRHFRGTGDPYDFSRKTLLPDDPRVLTGRLVVGCVRHTRVGSIRRALPASWTPSLLTKVVARIYRAATADDEENADRREDPGPGPRP